METNEIDWHNQALEFLRLHGWYQDKENSINPNAWFHKAFPLGEDFTASGNSPLEFVKNFYGEAWIAYEACIKGTIIASSEAIE